MAVHHRQIRSEFFVPFAAGVLAAISCHLRDRPLHRPHRREHLSGLYSFAAPLRFFSVDLDDSFLSLVRRLRRCRRHVVGGADEFSRRLVSARPNALLGLRFDVRVPRCYSAQQRHLSAGGNLHVGRRATHVGGAAVGECQCRSAACAAGVRERAFRAGSLDAPAMGLRGRYQIINGDHFRWPRWFLDAFLFLLGARQRCRHGPLHGPSHWTDYR